MPLNKTWLINELPGISLWRDTKNCYQFRIALASMWCTPFVKRKGRSVELVTANDQRSALAQHARDCDRIDFAAGEVTFVYHER